MLPKFDEFVKDFILERLIPRKASKRGKYKSHNYTRKELLPRRATDDKDSNAKNGDFFVNDSQRNTKRKRDAVLLKRGIPASLLYGKNKKRRKKGSKAKSRDEGNIKTIKVQKNNWQ